MKTRKLEVVYRVEFTTVIEVPENANNQEVQDAISDIEIPENKQNEYREGTFETLHVNDENGFAYRG